MNYFNSGLYLLGWKNKILRHLVSIIDTGKYNMAVYNICTGLYSNSHFLIGLIPYYISHQCSTKNVGAIKIC